MCWFHRWEIVDVQECTYVGNYYKDVDGTLVLRRCSRCGHLETYIIDGTWTLEQCREK